MQDCSAEEMSRDPKLELREGSWGDSVSVAEGWGLLVGLAGEGF